MKIEYTVGAREYEDVLAMQLKLERQTFWGQFRFWALNVGFLVITIINLLWGTAFSQSIRILFVLLAAAFLTVSGCQLYASGLMAHLLLPGYLKRGVVDPAYLGEHQLTCRGPSIRCSYGENTHTTQVEQINGVVSLRHCTAILAEGKIFEIVPNRIWQQHDLTARLKAFQGSDVQP